LNRRATQILPAQKSQVAAKIIALKFFPGDSLLYRSGLIREGGPFVLMPVKKFQQRLPVIPLCVNRRPAIRGQVREKFPDPAVVDFGCRLGGVFHLEHSLRGRRLNSTPWERRRLAGLFRINLPA